MSRTRSRLYEGLVQVLIVMLLVGPWIGPAPVAAAAHDSQPAQPGSRLSFSITRTNVPEPLAELPLLPSLDITPPTEIARQQWPSVAEANDLRPVVVGTEKGVYYTEDISDSSPQWQDLNSGLVLTTDKTIKAMWMETYARPDWWTGVLWAGTYSGIWMLANPFAGGTWEKRLDRDEFWEEVQGAYTPDVYSFQVVAVEGSPDAYGPVYALVHGRMNNGPYGYYQDNLWLVRSSDRFATWETTYVEGQFYNVDKTPGLAVAPHSGGQTLYVGYGYNLGSRKIRKSVDGGLSFSTVFSEDRYGRSITDLEIPFVAYDWDDSTIYAVGSRGTGVVSSTVLCSENSGQSWSFIGFNTPADLRFLISSDSHDTDKLAFKDAYRVYESTNGGQSWAQFGGATSMPARMNSFFVRRDAAGDIDDVLIGTLQVNDNGDCKVYLNSGGALVNKSGNLATVSGNAHQVWAIGQVPPMAPLQADSGWGGNECPFNNCKLINNWTDDPIDTATGNLTYQRLDLSIPTLGSPLRFERTYVAHSTGVYSTAIVYDGELGPGWTHNYTMQLVFSGAVGGESDTAILRAARGSRLRFYDQGNGSYVPYPGVYAQLVREGASAPYTYTVTAFDQQRYVFDDDGHLRYHYDRSGNGTTLSYDGAGRLDRVSDPSGERYLSFTYDDAGRISQVTDHSGRYVGYGYNGVGELAVITDTRGFTTTVTYTSTNGYDHLLEEIVGPDGQRVVRNAYDDQGRVTQQWDGVDASLQIAYSVDGVATVTDELGFQTVDTYTERGVLVAQQDALSQTVEKAYDGFFSPSALQDENGNVTRVHSNASGQPVSIQDAAGERTELAYDQWNNLVSLSDALTQTTEYEYQVVTRTVGGQVFTLTHMTAVTDALGNRTSYAYDEYGQVISTTDALGHSTWYAYDAYGQRTVMTDALGSVTTYGYDAVGRLMTTTVAAGTALERRTVNRYDDGDNLLQTVENYVDGTYDPAHPDRDVVTEYGYDVVGRRTWVTDTLGAVTRSEYDPAGRLVTTTVNYTVAGGQNHLGAYNLVTRYGYDEAGRQTWVTDTLGHVSHTAYDAAGRVEATVASYADGAYDPAQPDRDIVTAYGYDPAGQRTWVTDTLGHVSRTWYDEVGRVLSTTVNYSTAGGQNYLNEYNLVTSYEYDAVGNPVYVTDTLGRVTYTEYDGLNRPLTVTANYLDGVYDPAFPDQDLATVSEYDAVGNATATVDALGRVTSFDYDALGRVVTTTDALLGTTVGEYDAAGNRTAVTDAEGRTTRYAYDGLGRVVTTTDALSGTTVSQYDGLGRQTQVSDAEGNGVRYGYDAAGRMTSVTDALTGTTEYGYDALGRRTAITDALTHTTTYGYDGLGRTAAITDANDGVTRYAYDGLGRQTAITDAAGVATYSTYDALGRLAETEDALGHAVEYAYDPLGNRTALTDANQVETRYGYDARSRLITVTEAYSAGGPINEQTNVTTWYGYDGVGNRTVITDANSHAATYAYDELNRLVQASDPLTHTAVYTYDRVGNRTVVTDADGQATTYAVDALNRVTRVGYADGSVEYGYDRVGNRTAMTDATGVTTWTYDALYRPLTVTAPATGTVGYGYDAVGNRTRLAYPDGQVVTCTYDPANRLAEVEDWQAGATGYQYDEAGRPLTVTLPNGVQTTYGYDEAGRLTALRHELEGTTLAAYTYTLDAVGNRVQAGEEVSGTATTITYTYDALQRLTGADYSDDKDFTYAYDAAGNRTAYTETITQTLATTYTI